MTKKQIEKAIAEVGNKLKDQPKKVQEKILAELEKDLILPMLPGKGTKVETEVSSEYIYVYIGRRDWEFDLKGNLFGAGTYLG
jgi:hypothetical protein